jgi:hypothetical protein
MSSKFRNKPKQEILALFSSLEEQNANKVQKRKDANSLYKEKMKKYMSAIQKKVTPKPRKPEKPNECKSGFLQLKSERDLTKALGFFSSMPLNKMVAAEDLGKLLFGDCKAPQVTGNTYLLKIFLNQVEFNLFGGDLILKREKLSPEEVTNRIQDVILAEDSTPVEQRHKRYYYYLTVKNGIEMDIYATSLERFSETKMNGFAETIDTLEDSFAALGIPKDILNLAVESYMKRATDKDDAMRRMLKVNQSVLTATAFASKYMSPALEGGKGEV